MTSDDTKSLVKITGEMTQVMLECVPCYAVAMGQTTRSIELTGLTQYITLTKCARLVLALRVSVADSRCRCTMCWHNRWTSVSMWNWNAGGNLSCRDIYMSNHNTCSSIKRCLNLTFAANCQISIFFTTHQTTKCTKNNN